MKNNYSVEDSTLQAGWIFADLFLALTVIFLATVSFIPINMTSDSKVITNIPSEKSGMNSTNNPSKILISNGFIGIYRTTSANLFARDFKEYLLKKGAAPDTKAVFIEAIGFTSEYGVPNDKGSLEALKFVIDVRNLLAPNIEKTSTAIDVSPEVKAGFVKIKVTFV